MMNAKSPVLLDLRKRHGVHAEVAVVMLGDDMVGDDGGSNDVIWSGGNLDNGGMDNLVLLAVQW